MKSLNVLSALAVGSLMLFGACEAQVPSLAEAPAAELVPLTASVRHYCHQQVRLVQAEPSEGEACEVRGSGAGGHMEALTRTDRNTVSVSISSLSLEAAGLKSFSFLLNRGGAEPVFSTGVEVMDQVRVYDTDATDLPDRMAFGEDISGENSMFTHTAPDAAVLREKAAGVDFTGYEIASAVLTIDMVEDVPLDPLEREMAKKMGMVIGQQHITGTLSISLIPMGSTGEQFGPTTYAFATTFDWSYLKE